MRSNLRFKAVSLLVVFCFEIFIPPILQAGSGPSQPEMASFTPAGASDMVDPFTGNFTYNIPLINIEGYPINIAYNSGINMEQEASWVGLGWNLNVGTVNRSVRGLPDDFKGDQMTTESSMKDMKITKVGTGIGIETLGKGPLGASADISFIYNNYKGAGISFGPTLNGSLGGESAFGINGSVGFEINSLDGTSLNSSLGLSYSLESKNNGSLNFGGSQGSGYNTRTGQSQLSFGTTAGYSNSVKNEKNLKDEGSDTKKKDESPEKTKADTKESASRGGSSLGGSVSFLPIGLESYSPYPSLTMDIATQSYSATIGGEFWSAHPNGKLFGSQTVQKLAENNISKKAYGYLYSEHASNVDLLDFNREKNLELNKTVQFLSPGSATYDVFTVSGQGVSGMFRPHRSDIGRYGDPFKSTGNNSNFSLGGELGLGAFVKGGFTTNTMTDYAEYGAWGEGSLTQFNFQKEDLNSLYEKVYFKAAGELSEIDEVRYNQFGGISPIRFSLANGANTAAIKKQNNQVVNIDPVYKTEERVARTRSFNYLTAEQASRIGFETTIKSYTGEYHSGLNGLITNEIDRTEAFRKKHHISEITQINPDGFRYIFGIPAYNTYKEEVTYNTNANAPSTSFPAANRIDYSSNEASKNNNAGVNHFYTQSTTPPYAHSYLLTAQLSPDYRDLTGDGISYDDPGNAYKFNYTRTSADYKWRSPYSGSTFLEGFKSDDLDEKASFSYGSKEKYYVHSIESKNQVAEFFISPRLDAIGSSGVDGGRGSNVFTNQSFKLDSIVLYNKLDRLRNKENASPVKRVKFEYDYSLCLNEESNINYSSSEPYDSASGKLTLKKIWVYNGESQLGGQSPFVFTYSDYNPSYYATHSDRWGNFKLASENPASMSNADFPYTLDYATMSDVESELASAWSLTQIQLPSGGKIEIDYEQDDYAYVQNRLAMQMFSIVKAGDDNNYSTAGTTLYGNNFLFFPRPSSIPHGELSSSQLKQAFFGNKSGLPNMYFKFLTDIRGKNEYAAGYTNALNIGYSTDTAYLYLEIKQESPSAISNTAWAYFRQNLFNVLYDQPNINDSGFESILKGLVANMGDIKQMFSGVESYLESKNVANVFVPAKSFVRLVCPSRSKPGGGTRVAEIKITDNWNSMVNESETVSYGQTYDYTTVDDLGNEISSGVATYEPMIGGDENPFRGPIPYTSVGASGHIPAIEAYQETPFGESFIQGASVGYSKVTSKSIHYESTSSSNLITEHNFCTAKDYPVVILATGLEKYYSPAPRKKFSFPYSNTTTQSSYAASQGYSIVLNDMHGKPRSTINYTLVDIISGNYVTQVRKDLSGKRYTYYDKNYYGDAKMLDNQVQVIDEDGYLSTKTLGVEFDLTLESQKSYESSKSSSLQTNIDVIPAAGIFPIPIPIPIAFTNKTKNEKVAKTAVITKVFQTYGIVKEVESFTDQYATTKSNEIFNGLTGDVILSKFKNEFNELEYECNLPAYLMPDQLRLGPSYQNLGFRTNLEKDTNCSYAAYINPGPLKHGDEVMVYPYYGVNEGPIPLPYKAWVSLEYKDPNYDSKCKTYKYMHTSYDNSYCDGIQPGISATRSSMVRPADEFNLFHLKPEYAQIINEKMLDSIFKNLPYPALFNDSTDSSFCEQLSPQSTKFISVFHSGLNAYYQIPNSAMENLGRVFDLNDSIQGYIEDLHVSQTQSKHMIEYEPRHQTFYRRNQVFLSCFSDSVNLGGVDTVVNKYFMEYIGDSDPLPEYIIPYSNKNEFVLRGAVPLCPNAYSLLNRSGGLIGSLDYGDTIEVIRSGNRNMLSSVGAHIISQTNPLRFENNQFVGFKVEETGSNAQELLQANAFHYTDGYAIAEDSLFYNKFLAGSDGNFKIDSSFKFISSRYQSESNGLPEPEIKKDGRYEQLPDMWAKIDSPCFFALNPPNFNTVGGNSYGWMPIEKNVAFSYNGHAVESENILGIPSVSTHNQMNLVKAVALNTRYKHVFTDDFEEYFQLVGSTLTYNPTQALNPLYNNTTSLSTELSYKFLFPSSMPKNVLVEGLAHSGLFSLFLDGTYSGDTISINYPIEPLNYVYSQTVGHLNTTGSESQDLHYGNAKTAHYASFTQDLSAFVKAQLTSAVNQNKTELSFQVNDLDSNTRYVFSAWVKEMLSSNAPYRGAYDLVGIDDANDSIQVTLKPTGPVIDGWQKVEGSFTTDALSTITVTLEGGPWGVFYDDLRIHPFKSNMKTFVYDPISKRLKATLDENNYATFYNYDEQGIVSQIKKETDQGILTIKETRQSQFKSQP